MEVCRRAPLLLFSNLWLIAKRLCRRSFLFLSYDCWVKIGFHVERLLHLVYMFFSILITYNRISYIRLCNLYSPCLPMTLWWRWCDLFIHYESYKIAAVATYTTCVEHTAHDNLTWVAFVARRDVSVANCPRLRSFNCLKSETSVMIPPKREEATWFRSNPSPMSKFGSLQKSLHKFTKSIPTWEHNFEPIISCFRICRRKHLRPWSCGEVLKW